MKTILCTAFYVVLFLLKTSAQVSNSDSLALVSIYNSTGGENWNNNANWLSNEPVSEWFGVEVSDGRVTKVQLGYNNLIGELPVEIGNLTELYHLGLHNNSVTSVPLTIGNLIKLESLSFGDNLLESIPEEIGNLTLLTNLGLYENNLNTIPASIGNLTLLNNLFIYDNNLNNIPSSISNLENLVWLSIFNNQLTSIPEEIGNLVNLKKLMLYENQLTSIPPNIGDLLNLEYLELHNNQLDSLPAEIENLNNLVSLPLDNNNLNSIPLGIQNFQNLSYLSLAFNKLTFESIEPFMDILTYYVGYVPQDSSGIEQEINGSIGETITLTSDVGGQYNLYQWKKNDELILNATGSSLIIDSLSAQDTGSYVCDVTNSLVYELKISIRPIHIDLLPVNIEHKTIKEFFISDAFPNPAIHELRIKYKLPQHLNNGRLAFYDNLGNKISEYNLNKEDRCITVPLKRFDEGLHFYRLETNSGFSLTHKFVILK